MDSSLSSALTIVGVLLALVGVFLAVNGFCWVRAYMDRRRHEQDERAAAFIALSSPRHNDPRRAVERRVEAAVRDAKDGVRVCPGCEFTNPRRAASCVICSSPLKAKNKVASMFSRPTEGTTALQERVRNRREWMRGVNANGDVVWIRQHEHMDGRFASYVLQTKLRDDTDDCLITIAVNSPLSEPTTPLSAVGAALQAEFRAMSVQATPASEADASSVAFSSPLSSSAVRDVAASAWADFPSKLAQFITTMSLSFYAIDSSDDDLSLVNVHRSTLLSDSFDALATMSSQHATAAIRVEFVGEPGVDAGGVYREWCMVLYQQIITPEAGLFVCSDAQSQSFYLNRHSREAVGDAHLAHFLAVGRLIGRALMEGNVTSFHLALPLLKLVLGLPVGFDDLQYFDPDAHKNLKWLLDNTGVGVLSLDFTVTEILPSGESRVVELVAGGATIEVTDENKHSFVDCKVQYLLFESVFDQLYAFLKGVYEVVPVESLLLFDAEELDYLLSGSDEIDVDDWEKHTEVSNNLRDHPALPNFWKIVRELPLADRRSLLQFATGTTRVPPGGFSALTSTDGRQCPFSLQGIGIWRSKGCFRSHSCFNRLDLPMYLELDKLRDALLATTSDDSVGFTTA